MGELAEPPKRTTGSIAVPPSRDEGAYPDEPERKPRTRMEALAMDFPDLFGAG